MGFRQADGTKVRGQGCVVAEIGDEDLNGSFDIFRWFARLECGVNGPKIQRGDPALASRCPVLPPDSTCKLIPAIPGLPVSVP